MYLRLSEAVRANGDRHLRRAIAYLREMNFDYAQGSLAKARRNYRSAALLATYDLF